MLDKVYESFLKQQLRDGVALAASSDLLELRALDSPARHYVARFRCRGLVQAPGGAILEANHFAVGIYFPPDYLRRVDPFQVLAWLGPLEVFHPNINPPFICVGRLAPGTPLRDLLFQLYEIISFQKVTPREDDSLNKAACAWVRNNAGRIPVDRRPLKRRAVAASGERP